MMAFFSSAGGGTATFLLLFLLPCLTTSTTLPILHPLSPASPFHSLFTSSLAVAHGRRSSAPIASGASLLSTPSYVVACSLGSPPQKLLLSLSTSADTTLVPSSPQAFSPAKSSTFSLLQRTPFNVSYASAPLSAALAHDTLTLASDAFPSYSFAVVNPATAVSLPPQGLLGLGRGPLSLLSQTQKAYRSTFSYCLPSYRSANFTGSLRLGLSNQPIRIKTTPLLSNPHRPSLYYVSLTAIRVGKHMLQIPPSAFSFDSATGAGTVFDSGTLFTRLVPPAYEALRNEFRRRVSAGRNATSLGGFDTCYQGVAAVPTVSFHFDGMFVTLPPENVVIRSSGGPTVCLAMAATSPDPVNGVVNVIAGWQQQNHRVLVDVPGRRLGVAREPCSGV